MNKTLQLVVLILGIILIPLGGYAENVNWQLSSAVSIKLGIRAKDGMSGSYNATFIVTSPDRREFRVVKSVSDNGWGYVVFPDEFNTWLPGKYLWKCVVADKAVVRGQFYYNMEEVKIVSK